MWLDPWTDSPGQSDRNLRQGQAWIALLLSLLAQVCRLMLESLSESMG